MQAHCRRRYAEAPVPRAPPSTSHPNCYTCHFVHEVDAIALLFGRTSLRDVEVARPPPGHLHDTSRPAQISLSTQGIPPLGPPHPEPPQMLSPCMEVET